jgi:hypothetical protein
MDISGCAQSGQGGQSWSNWNDAGECATCNSQLGVTMGRAIRPPWLMDSSWCNAQCRFYERLSDNSTRNTLAQTFEQQEICAKSIEPVSMSAAPGYRHTMSKLKPAGLATRALSHVTLQLQELRPFVEHREAGLRCPTITPNLSCLKLCNSRRTRFVSHRKIMRDPKSFWNPRRKQMPLALPIIEMDGR